MKRVVEKAELLQLVHNALHTEIDEKGTLHFSRFTDRQLTGYAEASRRLEYDFMPKTRPASGVTLDFVTDADTLALTFRWEPVMTPYLRLDLLVDGVLWDSYDTDVLNRSAMGFRLPEGRHRVSICLPWSAEFCLKSLVLGDGASLETVGDGLRPAGLNEAPEYGKSLRILTLGDSITQGYYAKHPSMSYASVMAREMNAEALNQAIGGFVFDRTVLDPALKDWKPDVITVAYGTNDYGFRSTPERFRAETEGFMAELTTIFPDTRILGILPIYRNDANLTARRFIRDYSLEDAHEIIREVYAKYPNVTVLEDLYYPHTADCFAPDWLHPNDLGFQFMARAVVDKLRTM